MLFYQLHFHIQMFHPPSSSESGSDYDLVKERVETKRKKNTISQRQSRTLKKKKQKMKKKQKDTKAETKQKNTQRMRKQRQKIHKEKEQNKWPGGIEPGTYDVWNSNEKPPDDFLRNYQQDPRSAMCVAALIGGVIPDMRYPPKCVHPLCHQKKTCQVCGVVEFLRILADIRENPRNIDLDYDEVYAKVGLETLIWNPRGYGRALYLLFEVGFFRSADGLRFKWNNTRSNRFHVRWMDDYLDAHSEEQEDVIVCEHFEKENITCWGCSTKLMRNILRSIYKHGIKSKFCALDYATVKKRLNGSALGLNLLFDVGFVRSSSGHHFKWEDTHDNREEVAIALEEQQEMEMDVEQQQIEVDNVGNAEGCRHKIDENDVVEDVGLDGSDVVEEYEDEYEDPKGTSARHMCAIIRNMYLDDTNWVKKKVDKGIE